MDVRHNWTTDTRLRDVIERYSDASHLFTRKQWEALRLCFELELPQNEAARLLGKSPSSMCALLTRAKGVMACIDRQRRAEQLDLLRRGANSC